MPGSAPRMMSNWSLIAVTAPSIGRRCSASTPSSADPSVARFAEVLARLFWMRMQRDRHHGDDHDDQQDGEEDEDVVLAHAPPNPSVSAFM